MVKSSYSSYGERKPGTPVHDDDDDAKDREDKVLSNDTDKAAADKAALEAAPKAVEAPPVPDPKASVSNTRFVFNDPKQGLPEPKEPPPELMMVDGLPAHPRE